MKFKIFGIKKNWKFQKIPTNWRSCYPKIFSTWPTVTICAGPLPTKPKFFPTLSASIVFKTTNGQDQVQQDQRSRSVCSFLSVPTYQPTIFLILILIIFFSLSLSNSPMRSLSTNPTVKLYPATDQLSHSLSRSSATKPTVTICAAPPGTTNPFPTCLTTPLEIFWQQNPTVEICAECCHHQRFPPPPPWESNGQDLCRVLPPPTNQPISHCLDLQIFVQPEPTVRIYCR